MNIRPNFIDFSKVLCMFLVIYGHYIPYLGLEMGDNFLWHTVHVINLFHMPLFFISVVSYLKKIVLIIFSTKEFKE